jgi:cell well associated rhsD protein (fragment)
LQGAKLYRATKSELIEQNSNFKKHLTMTLRNTKRIINYCVLIIERLTDKFIGRSDYSPVAYGLLPKPGGTGGNYDPHVKGKNVSAFIVHSVTH